MGTHSSFTQLLHELLSKLELGIAGWALQKMVWVKITEVLKEDVTVDNSHIHLLEEKCLPGTLPPPARLDQHIVGANHLVRLVDAAHLTLVVTDHHGSLDQLHHPAPSILTQPPENVNRYYKIVLNHSFSLHCTEQIKQINIETVAYKTIHTFQQS